MTIKVLLIDDDVDFLTCLQFELEQEHFGVYTAADGLIGLQKAYEVHPDMIILDLMMPDIDGWTICQRLRTVCDTPIIMLTAKSEMNDVVKGLSMGADDYMVKPCNFEELKARIYTVLRRTTAAPGAEWRSAYDDGVLYVDLESGVVTKNGELVTLTDTESRLFLYLVSHKDQVVPHRELLTNVWGPQYVQEIGYLSVYIRYIRCKIEDDPNNPQYIQKRWGLGYYFTGKGTLAVATFFK
ncbi:MAG TPA: response regulator transcription factor [Anaerolineae bacterium]|nr:response regulator transcription factor [Anaerolineae bacterium]